MNQPFPPVYLSRTRRLAPPNRAVVRSRWHTRILLANAVTLLVLLAELGARA
jgi:hypothetical protein